MLGEQLTQADIEFEAVQPALLLLGDFVKETNYTGPVQLIPDLRRPTNSLTSANTPHSMYLLPCLEG
jgi:hypothetical protein